MNSSIQHHTCDLNDHRWSYLSCGDSAGHTTIIYFHGYPGSRLEATFLHDAAISRGLRIIAIDRPGFGESSGPYASYTTCATAIGELLDHLGVTNFGILSVSGGTPSGIATAARSGGRVHQITVVSGLGPLYKAALPTGLPHSFRHMLQLQRSFPWLAARGAEFLTARIRSNPARMIAYLRKVLPPSDQVLLSNPIIRDLLLANTGEALRQGPRGVLNELCLMVAPWSIDLRAINIPITFFHGDADEYVPFGLLSPIVAQLPQAQCQIIHGGGHFVALSIVERVLETFSADQ